MRSHGGRWSTIGAPYPGSRPARLDPCLWPGLSCIFAGSNRTRSHVRSSAEPDSHLRALPLARQAVTGPARETWLSPRPCVTIMLHQCLISGMTVKPIMPCYRAASRWRIWGEVRIGQADERIDAVQQSRPRISWAAGSGRRSWRQRPLGGRGVSVSRPRLVVSVRPGNPTVNGRVVVDGKVLRYESTDVEAL
jgi:hypothetical protein